ncbi:MAG TPA: prepilin-type N-terminal cleavage/methylation domain-containing protein [Thermoanaerobacterales bacterium]|nr:prepilin-type N-terminal cleavage/methylation domain-containing protein [Thermoanaerobacterales bacterium]
MLHRRVFIKKQRGFTLIELIISLAIMSIVMITAFNMYNAGIREYQYNFEQMELKQNVRQAVSWLSTSIRQAKKIEIISENYITLTFFDGEKVNYYLEKGVLYREKNKGKNPVAYIDALTFYKPIEQNYIKIDISAKISGEVFKITTKVTPICFIIN